MGIVHKHLTHCAIQLAIDLPHPWGLFVITACRRAKFVSENDGITTIIDYVGDRLVIS